MAQHYTFIGKHAINRRAALWVALTAGLAMGAVNAYFKFDLDLSRKLPWPCEVGH